MQSKTMKGLKNFLRGVFFIFLVVVIAFGGVFFGKDKAFGEKFKAAKTVEKISEGLYILEFKGDYGFDSYLRQGGGCSSQDMKEFLHKYLSCKIDPKVQDQKVRGGCSTISAMTQEEGQIFGRNYDWEKGNIILVHTVPKVGYESISTTALDFLSYGENWEPIGMTDKLMALSSIYIPIDGINEKGLVVADLTSGDNEETDQNRGLTEITTTAAVRMMLDYAQTVDEAIWLLEKCDMHSDIGISHHYAIKDKTGRSVVVEYIDGEMIVTETDVVTNHYLSPGEKYGIGSDKSHLRFNRLKAVTNSCHGIMTKENIKEALISVDQSNTDSEYALTAWSNIYDQENLSIDFYRNEDYSKCYKLKLGEKEWIKR